MLIIIAITWAGAMLTERAGEARTEQAGESRTEREEKARTERAETRRKAVFLTFLLITVAAFFVFRLKIGFAGVLGSVGLSFYSLQAIGYMADVYMKKTKAEGNILKYAAYVSFFPTVISGPIQRSTGLLKEIREGTAFSYELARTGVLMMLSGYLQKILIADRIHLLIEPLFSDIALKSGAALLFGCLMYGIELYADFAGYSLIAIGAANLLGFRLDDNFRRPYFAADIRDFWRRWHISLSSFLRDYVYIPLGGNRKGTFRKYVNLMITFLVSGIWHGNGFKYIAWGILHGLYQVAGSIVSRGRNPVGNSGSFLFYRLIKCFFTFLLVEFGWIFFRAGSLRDVFLICRRILFNFGLGATIADGSWINGYGMPRFLLLAVEIVIFFIADHLTEKHGSLQAVLDKRPPVIRRALYILAATALITGALYNYGTDPSTFIYAQF
ncbi:MAG: MBOAT family protein [Lachnospiraceae bacterium]|nr:MBOAT family protein [Lachnospiraceae bacterium]